MKIFIPELSGFCPGVKYAEQKIFQEKAEHNDRPIYVYGYMINNRNYIDYLENQDIHTTDTPWDLPKSSSVVIRTHGIDRSIEKRLRDKYNVIDLTCKNVKKVQLKIEEESDGGAFIVLTGKKTHPEILGLVSYADHFQILETKEDLTAFLGALKRNIDAVLESCTKIFIASQTTGDASFFVRTVRAIGTLAGKRKSVSYFDSICPITASKEKEALKIQEKSEITFVIGDTLSSNANKLYRILNKANDRTFLVQDLPALVSLGLDLSSIDTAQVVSSASTPDFVEKAVIDYLNAL